MAVGLGVAGAAVAAIGSWNPSFWGDEAASVMSATRPLSSLLPMLVNIDAVHGAYYLFLHGWILLFGASEFATRLPSALAAGITVAGVTLLAARLNGTRVALFAGITCAVLPRLTLMGTETRPYAISAACAVWLTLLFVRLIDDGMPPLRRGWLLYGIGVALSIYAFLYLALMLLVHLIILLSVTRSRSTLRSFARAAGIGLAIALPVIVLAIIQRNQVSFLENTTQTRIDRLLVEQWFGNDWFAALAWLLIAAVIGAGVSSARDRSWFLAPRHPPDLLLVAFCWLFVPWVVLLLLHSVIPLYSMRYLTFTAPAAALLIGMAVAIPSRRFASWLLVAAVIGTSLPSWVQQREPHAKNGSDWRQVAATIGASASTGDAVLFQDQLRSSLKARSAWHLYPDHFAGLHDVLLDQPYHRTTWLWDDTHRINELPDRITGIDRVWVVNDRGSRWAIEELEQLDFSVVRSRELHRTTIHELIRSTD
ncbi:glycosyltransferase family 39 protein [Diaminobutyricimonas sp. LJ205]|uniref:glycosyltransferase family 39 protein n=1 Tax=Diaminobutyricimonas sp. LJ205 TaxID=2683590 RepID=UPI0012F52162|nr:glycosyltransferase family 39 protein [Diaminobutyricimonas sp. LJ205]